MHVTLKDSPKKENMRSIIENINEEYCDKEDMAYKLYWRPFCQNGEALDNPIRWILKDENMVNTKLCAKDISFLRGVRAAFKAIGNTQSVNDAQSLIEAIERFGDIELFEQPSTCKF
jgi:hypothetical protein